jgi:hypothetical protein
MDGKGPKAPLTIRMIRVALLAAFTASLVARAGPPLRGAGRNRDGVVAGFTEPNAWLSG